VKIKNGRSGFTIVEMLLVVGLIVLLVGAAGGIYTGTYKKALVRKSASDFFLAAKYARVLAIERAGRCRLKLDAANNGFTLIIDEVDKKTEETEQLAVRDIYFKPVKFSEDVKFEDIQIRSTDSTDSGEEFETGRQSIITFQPDGTAQEAVVQIGDGKNHYTVCVSAGSGKAKIYSEPAKNIKSDTIDLDEEQG